MEDKTVDEAVSMKGSRVVIPASMRSEFLDLIHKDHLATEEKQRVNKCATCLTHQYQQRREPLMPTQHPWLGMPEGIQGTCSC